LWQERGVEVKFNKIERQNNREEQSGETGALPGEKSEKNGEEENGELEKSRIEVNFHAVKLQRINFFFNLLRESRKQRNKWFRVQL